MDRKIKNYLKDGSISVCVPKDKKTVRNSFSCTSVLSGRPVSSSIFSLGTTNKKLDEMEMKS